MHHHDRGLRGVRVVDTLDIDELPRGHISRLQLEIGHDALGAPMLIPIMVARGEKPGPTFGLTAVVHGDELNGIPVIHRLFDRLDVRTLRGTVVAVVVVNLPGFHAGTRLFDGRTDLNHIMPGRPGGNAADMYAHRFVQQVVRHFDYLIDMHTASVGCVNSLYIRADMTNEVTARMAYLQRPQIIVHNPPSDGTLRGAAMELGIPAITVEIGDPGRFQTDLIRRTLVGLRAVLADVGMVPRRKLALGEAPVVCERSLWLYTDHGGLLEVFPELVEEVEAEQHVARVIDIFGEVLCEYPAPASGVIIGKSINPVAPTGARILHLGIRADPDSPFHSREVGASEASEES